MRLRIAVLALVLAAPLVVACGSSSSVPSATPVTAPDRVAPDVANQGLAVRVRETGRADVAICLYVDPSTGLNADAARSALQGSVDALVQQGYSALGAKRVALCAEAPVFLRTNTVHPKNSGSGPVGGVPFVTTPSPFLLFVAVTTPARISTIFGGLTIRRGAEEAACPSSRDNCAEVTGSIYADPTAFANAAIRQRLVLEGLGLLGAK